MMSQEGLSAAIQQHGEKGSKSFDSWTWGLIFGFVLGFVGAVALHRAAYEPIDPSVTQPIGMVKPMGAK